MNGKRIVSFTWAAIHCGRTYELQITRRTDKMPDLIPMPANWAMALHAQKLNHVAMEAVQLPGAVHPNIRDVRVAPLGVARDGCYLQVGLGVTLIV